MKFTEYESGKDQYDRKYPLKIVFKDGKTVYGHTVVYRQSGDKTTDIIFALIENIDEWCININKENRERIQFNDDVIEQISIFKNY